MATSEAGEPAGGTLLSRHRSVMPSWLAIYYDEPIEIVRGKGRRVTDATGTEYLDFFAGILTNGIGYDIAEISDAIRSQVDTGILHTSTLYLLRQQVELAEKLARLFAQPGPGVVRARRLPLPQPVPGPLRPRLHSRLHRRSAQRHRDHHRRRRGLPDRRADPGRRRLLRTAARPVRRVQGSPRRVRHPVRLRRGADRLGPYRGALLGDRVPRRDARRDHVREGAGQRHRDRWRDRPAGPDGLLPGQLDLHVRRQPDRLYGRQRRSGLSARPRPAGQRGTTRLRADVRPEGHSLGPRCRRGCQRHGPDGGRRVRRTRPDPEPRRGRQAARRDEGPWPAGRQGRPVRQRDPDVAPDDRHRGRGGRGAGDPRGIDRRGTEGDHGMSGTKRVQHWIGGKPWDGVAERTGEIFNPATGEVAGAVDFAGPAEVDEAVDTAARAFTGWRNASLAKRSTVLFRFRDLLAARKDEIAAILTAEHGKVLSDAGGEVQRALEVAEFACGVPHLLKGGYSENASSGVDVYSIQQPLGVVAIISPFNFPAMVPLWFAPLAIACGNTVVLKPSEKDPSASVAMAKLWAEAGLPDGVFNVVHGDKVAVDRLLEHLTVKAVSFVGSTPVARYIYETGTRHGKRVQALGGAKNHMVVLPDADLELAANAAVSAGFGSAGERCMAISAVVAVDPIGDDLVAKIASRMADVHVGNGTAIFTDDGGAARRFQYEVEVGMVGVNVPIPVPVAYYSFGGWKQSLFGDAHAYGPDGIRFYTRTKAVTSRWLDPSHGGVSLGFPQNV